MPLDTSSAPAVRSAHEVLRSIRRVKTVTQLQEAYEGFITFIRSSRQQMMDQAARAEAAAGRKNSPKGHHRATPFSPPLSQQLALDGQSAVSNLKQVSLLCGAFCRRVEHVLRSTYAYADVDDAAHRGPASARISSCMTEIAAELRLFNTPALNKLLSHACKTGDVSTWSAAGASPVDCALSYGVGDLCDYRLYRRIRAHNYLQQLLAQPQWNTTAITQVIVALNETLSVPTDTFSLCTGDDAVEATSVVTPLRDPISQTVIRVPGRGALCVHLELFDVESFVQATQQRSLGTVDVGGPCPLCTCFVGLAAIRVDKRAMEAMRQYEESERVAAAAAGAAAAAAAPLTADCALEWNTAAHTVTVVRGRRAAAGSSAAAVAEDAEDPVTPRQGARAESAEASTKKRRIEIGGHVLYAD